MRKVPCDPKKMFCSLAYYVLKHLTCNICKIYYIRSNHFLDSSSKLATLAFNNLSIHSIFMPQGHFFFYGVNSTLELYEILVGVHGKDKQETSQPV